MKKFAAALAAAALAGGLLTLAPTSAQAATCDDPTHPIADTSSGDVAIGTTDTKTLRLAMVTVDGCRVIGASVTVKGPRSTKTVALRQVHNSGELVFWEGSLTISPKSLKNSDAGTWALTYRATGPDAQTATDHASVRRAARLSFNAGPEPVKNHQLTYTGTLERASWDKHHYYGYRHQVVIDFQADPHEDSEVVARPTTRPDGTFTVVDQSHGAGDYSADFVGTSSTAHKRSRIDHIA